MDADIRARITKSIVDKLPAGHTVRDSELKGFGVRRQKGEPIYFLQKKIHGRNRWFTIGTHGSPWTPDTARKKAFEILRDLAAGADPTTEKTAARANPTVAEAAPLFMAAHGVHLKARTHEEYERLLRLLIVPNLGGHRVADIKKTEVTRLQAKLPDKPSQANFMLAVLSKFMGWCEEQGYRPAKSNPCSGVKKFRQNKRERYLTAEEYARLGQVLDQLDGVESPFILAAIRLLLLTGARLNEILTLEWSHVRLDLGLLLLPDSKTGQKAIRLNGAAIALLSSLPRVAGNAFVITGHRHGAHLVNLQKPWRRIREMAGLEDVRIHDLRHSFASVAAASGASLPMIGKLLGHTQPQTTARYAHLADDPLREVNEKVGNIIAGSMPQAKPTPKC